MTRKPETPKAAKEPKLSRTRAPSDIDPMDWQRTLCRQFSHELVFGLENLGAHPFFSEFRVTNPQSKSHYPLARGYWPAFPELHLA